MLVVLGLTGAGKLHANDIRLITVGGAGINGNYFAFAKAICKIINEQDHGNLHCSPEATPGSPYNLFALRDGELDFALVQSDWQRKAVEGKGRYAGEEGFSELHSVMSLYREAVTLVARKDAGINIAADLEGKIVDLGPVTSARRGTLQQLIDTLGLPPDFFGQVLGLDGSSSYQALCDGMVDASILVMGHPNALLGETLDRCNLRLVPVVGPLIDAFVEENADYSPYRISSANYKTMIVPIPTYSVSATLMTRAGIDADVVEIVTNAILTSGLRLNSAVPVVPDGTLPFDRLDDLTAPIHPSALPLIEAAQG